jgi:thiosulfate reductase cytochrome b subunit
MHTHYTQLGRGVAVIVACVMLPLLVFTGVALWALKQMVLPLANIPI